MSLHDYNAKRRFDQTPEPAGETPARANTQPIFVVQLHHASSRHYDFRLEADGVLKSWAVPKGPSLRVGEKRLAVQVEDHPLSYASFEGDIPQGHYGAGHVDVFDHGHWHCEGDALAALEAGKLEFELQGTLLRGGFALVRTQMRGGKPQWLLFKRTDAYAADLDADALVAQQSAGASGVATSATRAKTASVTTRGKASRAQRVPPEAIAGTSTVTSKRVRSGRAESKQWRTRALALDGARDAPCPTELRAQLTLLREQAPEGERWLHEIKWDGYRLLADMVDGNVQLRSRNDQAWTQRFPDVVRALQALPVRDARLDGELVVLDAQGRSDFSALQRALDGSVTQPLRYIVFDLLGVAGVDLRGTPLLQRKQLLRELLGDQPGTLAFSDHVIGHGPEVFAASAGTGWEGIVSKLADAPYRAGRSADWVKTKHEDSDEFVVVGYTDPKGARSGFGALLMAQREGKTLRYVGRVGTGFDDALLGKITALLQALHSDTATLELPTHIPGRPRDVHWVRPVLIAEVAFRGWAKEGLLRQAAFKRLREDKPMSELGGDRAAPGKARAAGKSGGATKAIAPARKTATKKTANTTVEASTRTASKRVRSTASKTTAISKTAASGSRAAKSAASRSTASTSTPTDGITITHPERVVFSAVGISKGDVADYYRAVAPLVLAEIARRPLSLLRCPDGAGGDCFFQKHEGRHLGAHIKAIALKQKSGTEDYIYVEDVAGLLELVQMNTLELHPWGAQVDDPEHPDRLVFDLDPGDAVSWSDVVAAARDIRAKLRSAGLESAVRLSGGKGLHVVVPIVPEAGWEQARDFCEAFAQALATHTPDRYVATMSKAKRHGVIFVDWLRNGRGNTSVCSWSLRAREKATVAVPLRWEELGKISGPDAFPMDKALQRAKRQRADPWESVLALKQYLPTGDDKN
ncbi:Multifunctional non-homologous end joining protein LigD [Xanthomonas hydrangeae]|uniref:DNA ligase D n=1 Tax=Xanthomonas hydrangeae TaxID=2775159 RepID=UPI00196516E3|nr:Multifunctional non-homologous end joining protein LigD [Xanthomonas hydrangeae]CAD7712472.1 Multifunctional non-homologous end joining protein LigD [Xanthomonas hydrangeae]CAD7717517.1 Multifunctional non-homologous end joining protein LigD [Xanthomonas hydrangeae]CAD7717519.1 Multifunctional non-homologous end joining protein LigD [Xanthomonas hydrangeae]